MLTVFMILGVGVIMIVIELIAPGRSWPKVTGWWARAIVLNGVQVAMVFIAGLTWDRWLQGVSLWKVEIYLGQNGGTLIGYLAITFIYYWWHRMRHQVPLLWRIFHQMHHSPQRLEVLTSFYKHPVEIVVNSVLSSAILYLLCGVSPQSAAQAIMLTGLAELFYHWNVRTPYWVGFILQRPESHCVHHQRGWHTQNYSDLPVWDMMFGTFYNPHTFDKTCGFAENREQHFGDILRGVDVNPPKRKAS